MNTLRINTPQMTDAEAIQEGVDDYLTSKMTEYYHKRVGDVLYLSASDISFVALAREAGLANIHDDDPELLAFLKEQELTGAPYVLMANHSLGGRDWSSVTKPPFFPETGMSGGWHVLTEDNARSLWWESATSGSQLAAEKSAGRWNLELQVPIRDGAPYKGVYWNIFHKIVGNET